MRSFYVNPPQPDFEVVNPESDTIPDQSLSVRDILMRFTRGEISIPPPETGDSDDIDDDHDQFDDLVDAFDHAQRFDDLSQQFLNEVQPKADIVPLDRSSSEVPPSDDIVS